RIGGRRRARHTEGVTRRRFWISVVLAALVVSAAAVWLGLPTLVRWAGVWQGQAQTRRRLGLQGLELGLLRGPLRLTRLRSRARDPGPPLAEFDRLDVRFRPGQVLRGHPWMDDVTLSGPRLRIIRTGRGELNISDLLGRSKPRQGTAPL